MSAHADEAESRRTLDPLPPLPFTSAPVYDPAEVVTIEFIHRVLSDASGRWSHRREFEIATDADVRAAGRALRKDLGAVLRRSFASDALARQLWQLPDDGALVYLSRGRAGNARCTVAAEGGITCQLVLARVRQAWPTVGAVEDRVPVRFWYLTRQGPDSHVRRLHAPGWAEVAGNYPERVRAELGRLMAVDGSGLHGRLLLFHGVPGTGKTHAALALARSWPWADVHYVIDPDKFFGEAQYMVSVIAGGHAPEGDGEHTAPRATLIVVEDADEFITSDARDRSGQSLSRLLNLTDGLIGRGLNTVVLLTTNEPVTKLHPAIRRPGRCLADIEFVPFPTSETGNWCLEHGLRARDKPHTLAELFELREQPVIATGTNGAGIGFLGGVHA